MKSLFIDSSAFLAILFDEPRSADVAGLLKEIEQVYASTFLEAEVRSAANRKGLPSEQVDKSLSQLLLYQPDRALTTELKAVLTANPQLRGADSWHLACALYLAGDPSTFSFMTLDGAQALAAARLGFTVLPGDAPTRTGAHESRASYRAGKILKKRKK